MSAPQGVRVHRSPSGIGEYDYWEDDNARYANDEPGRWFTEAEAEILIAVFEAAMQQSMVRGTPIKVTWKDDPS